MWQDVDTSVSACVGRVSLEVTESTSSPSVRRASGVRLAGILGETLWRIQKAFLWAREGVGREYPSPRSDGPAEGASLLGPAPPK